MTEGQYHDDFCHVSFDPWNGWWWHFWTKIWQFFTDSMRTGHQSLNKSTISCWKLDHTATQKILHCRFNLCPYISLDLNYLLVQPSLLYLGFRTWKLALFSIFQTVRDVLPKAQSWSQFRGLNTKETTSCPACGCVQIGWVVSQFLHDTVMVTVTELPCLNKHNWNIGGTQCKVVYCFQWLTTLLWCGLVERNKSPNKDHHHLMSEMCNPAVLFLENRISGNFSV